jgi:hypothetical protein
LNDKRLHNTSVCSITLSKGYYHSDRLFISRHRLLNLPDKQCTTQRWAERWAGTYRSSWKKIPILSHLNSRCLVTNRNRKKRYIRPSTDPFKHQLNTTKVKTDTPASYSVSPLTTCRERRQGHVLVTRSGQNEIRVDCTGHYCKRNTNKKRKSCPSPTTQVIMRKQIPCLEIKQNSILYVNYMKQSFLRSQQSP